MVASYVQWLETGPLVQEKDVEGVGGERRREEAFPAAALGVSGPTPRGGARLGPTSLSSIPGKGRARAAESWGPRCLHAVEVP